MAVSTRRPLGVLFGVAAVVIAVGYSAQEVIGAAAPKRTIREAYGAFTVPVGADRTFVVGCPTGTDAIGGSFSLISGNYMYVLAAGPDKGAEGYVFHALVPNRITAPGVRPAGGKLKAICATEGQPLIP